MSYDPRYDDPDVPRPRRQPAPERGPSPVRVFLLLGLGALIAAAIILLVGHFRKNSAVLTDPDAKPREVTPKEPLDHEEREGVDLFKKLRPSVVNVDIVQVKRVGWDDRPSEQQTAAGSGFIWDDDGHIVTNYHVIEDVLRRPNLTARVMLADRSAYDAVIVGSSPEYDLAVLQFAPDNRPAKDKIKKIDLGTSHDLEVGQKAYAIGNPLGLSLTMTKGIISALGRPLRSPASTTIPGGIQTDAAINHGNSGGPLLDKSGRLIGVNSSIATMSENGGNIGIGFAIPADLVNEVVTQLIQSGRVLRPDLGIKLYDQQKLRRARYDHGVMVETTTPNGPAAKAGLQGLRVNPRNGRVEPGDLIVSINGEAVDSVEDYERVLRKLTPGETVKLRIVRKEAEQEVNVTVGGA
jgi:S1-C subfamily serine protease